MTVWLASVVYDHDYRGEDDVRLGIFATEALARAAAEAYLAEESYPDTWHALVYSADVVGAA